MSWSTPQTWLNQVVREGDLNRELRDNLTFLKTAVGDDGKIPALSSTYFSDPDVSSFPISGVGRTNHNSTYTGIQNFNAGAGTRFRIPIV